MPDLAPMLWHSFGTVAALLQEIVNIYPAIHPPHLTVKYETVLIVITTSPTQCLVFYAERVRPRSYVKTLTL